MLLFSPNTGATDLVVRTIESAKTSVRVAAYSFTSKPGDIVLLEAYKRGVDVRCTRFYVRALQAARARAALS